MKQDYLCACPLCKNTPTLEQLVNHTDLSTNDEFKLFSIELYDPSINNDPFSQPQCNYDKGEAVLFTINCPHCGVAISDLFRNQHDEQKNNEILAKNILKKWNKMTGSTPEKHCPLCKEHLLFDDEEFIYPSELTPVGDYHNTYKYEAHCDAGGVGCGFSIKFKSNRNDAKQKGLSLWNEIYKK